MLSDSVLLLMMLIIFMGNQAGFILKVLVISAGLSLLIKYGGSALSIPATLTTVLMLVFVPTLVMTIALGARFARSRPAG